MRIVCFLLLVAFCATTMACAVALTNGGQAVKVMKSDPPSNCREIGSVSGSGSGYQSASALLETAKNEMRNNAAEMGANYVRWEVMVGATVNGTAYRCP